MGFWERVVPVALRKVLVARANAAATKAVEGSKGLGNRSDPQHQAHKGGGVEKSQLGGMGQATWRSVSGKERRRRRIPQGGARTARNGFTRQS